MPTPPSTTLSPDAIRVACALVLGVSLLGGAVFAPTCCTPAQVAVVDLGANAVAAVCKALQLTDPVEIAACAVAADVPAVINALATLRAEKLASVVVRDAGIDAALPSPSALASGAPLLPVAPSASARR